MFGYIKPSHPEMRIRDWETYRGVYCGVCRQLRKRFGPFSRLILSYDSVFLAMLVASLGEQAPCFCSRRCKLHPWRKDPCCLTDSSLEFAADTAMLLFYQKLQDDRQDGGWLQKLRSSLLRRIFRRPYEKAGKENPQAKAACEQFAHRQGTIEQQAGLPIDHYADPTAQTLGILFSLQAHGDAESRILRRLGYLFGRWVYFADAVDDLASDRKKNRFNPFLSAAGQPGLQETFREKAAGLLNVTQAELAAAYELLEPRFYRPVLQNILYLGLAETRQRLLYPEQFPKKPGSVSLHPDA